MSEHDLAQATALREAALEHNAAWDLLESLTTEVGARLPGSPGDARAVAWAQARFEALGFDRVAAEPVAFPRWRRGDERARVVAPYPQPLAIAALGGSVGTPPGGLEAEIAHFATLEDLEAAADSSLGGRIAFVSRSMERFRDGAGYAPVVKARTDGAGVAARKGAGAILIRSVGTDRDRLPHTGMMRYPAEGARIPAAALSNPDADQLERMLGRGAPVRVTLSIHAGIDGEATSHNVIGDLLGAERPDQYVVIGCHLDSWDLGTGAIDDGAGCAITMAAAALIARLPARPRRTIRVILWANEEFGLIGAKAYFEAHRHELAGHVIGAESDFGAGRVYAFSTRVKPSALGVVDQISQILGPLGIARGDNSAGGGPDLVPWRQAGMALATLHQDGTDYFDYHHTANDTLDKVDPAALTQNVAAWAAFTYLAAQAPDDFGFDLEPSAEPPASSRSE